MIAKEIGKTIRSRSITRTSIDGAITFSLILYTGCVILVSMGELESYVSLLNGVERPMQMIILIIVLMFWMSITAIVSLLITHRGE